MCRALGRIVVMLTIALCACGCSTSYLEIHDHMVVGDELRLLVETFRSPETFSLPDQYSPAERVDERFYLVTIDLTSDVRAPGGARVYGPVLRGGDKDDCSIPDTPAVVFGPDGELVRKTCDLATKSVRRAALVVTASGATWKRQAIVTLPDGRILPAGQTSIATRSGFELVYYADGHATLFDTMTYRPKEDLWLTASFVEAMKVAQNGRVFLTDDLKHLVIVRSGSSRDGLGDSVVFSRPDLKPRLFPALNGNGAFSIDGRLYLLINDARSLRLHTPDGAHEFRIEADGPAPWPDYPGIRIQHVPARDELIIFNSSRTADDDLDTTLTVARWNYKSGALRHHDIRMGDLFTRTLGHVHPRSVRHVKSGT